jgi:hypothetical protein
MKNPNTTRLNPFRIRKEKIKKANASAVHLQIVKIEAIKNNFNYPQGEVRGIHYDIDALRLYLALTCVDILSSNFKTFSEYIQSNCDDYCGSEPIKTYLTRKTDDYHKEFQISANFVKAFRKASEKPLIIFAVTLQL